MTVIINGTTGITSVNGSAAAPSVTGTDTDTGIVYGTNTLSLATGGTSGLTQDSSQNVGFGTTTPADRLDIRFATGSGVVRAGVVSGNNVKVYNTSGDISLLSSDASSDVVLDSQRNVTLKATNTTVATVKKDYSFALQGGTSSAGVGITFPATQSASSDVNTLDDYEEGTWTPVMRGAGTAGTYTGTFNGSYTKIGRVVTVYGQANPGTAASGGSNYMQITGLPFVNSYQSFGSMQMAYVNMSDTAKYWAVTFISSTGTTTVYVTEVYDNAATTDLSIGAFSTLSSFNFSLTYMTTT